MAKKSTMPKRGKAPAPKPVSAEPDGEKERLTDLAHSDELGDMVDRLYGVTAAIDAVFNDGPDMPLCATGAFRLLEDVCDKMQACAAAFEAEWLLRMPPEQRELQEAAFKRTEEHQ
jgi:hypothetical protein